MSYQDYQIAKSLLEETGGDFEGPKSERLVLAAEQALELSFPPSYRRFLLEFGCGDINGFEVYGLIDDQFDESKIPNGIWLTLNERRNSNLKSNYIIIGEDGLGGFYAIDTEFVDASAEGKVMRLTADFKCFEIIAPSFGKYFLDCLRDVT